MKKINFSVVFNRKKTLDKRGEAPIHIRANQLGKTIYFNTGISITPEQWNMKKSEVNSNHPHYIQLTTQIADFKSQLFGIYQKLKSENRVSLLALKEYYDKKDIYNDNSFLNFWQRTMDATKQAPNTTQNENTTLQYLKQFKKEIRFTDLNFELITNMQNQLKADKHPNTVYKYLKHVKKYINLAIKSDLMPIDKNPFNKIKIKQTEFNRKVITFDEFEKFLTLRLPAESEHLQPVLDMYLMALYTGLRFQDILILSHNHFITDQAGNTTITLKMTKTNKTVEIPLNNIEDCIKEKVTIPQFNSPDAIIKRNKILGRNIIFATISNKQANKQMKQIGKLYGVKTSCTFHSARHGIADYLTNIALFPITGIQLILGHSNLRTTQVYSHMKLDGVRRMFDLRIVHNANNKQKAM